MRAQGDGPAPTRLLRLRSAGMFSNVNEVVQQVHLALAGGYRFAIDWSDSCYRDPAREGDPWAYYFEPVFPEAPPPPPGATPLPGGVPVACTRDNVITPRLADGRCDPLLLPRDRHAAAALVDRAIRLNPATRAELDRSLAGWDGRTMVGLHIRGPGRTDGGTPRLRARLDPAGGVPLDHYFAAADAALARFPGAGLFACSDSDAVMRAVHARYGERVHTYAASRSDFGEMHARPLPGGGLAFPPHKLGLDVVIEAHLLARCAFLVHGNSNVANFVLCRAPDLPSHYLYDDLPHAPG